MESTSASDCYSKHKTFVYAIFISFRLSIFCFLQELVLPNFSMNKKAKST